MIKKVIILLLAAITLSSCSNSDSAELNFNIDDLNDLNYSSDYLYYNMSYENISFNQIEETSDILLLINLTIDNGLSYCVWKESHFEVVKVIYGDYTSELSIIKYPIEAYDIETNELKDYPAINSGLYLLYLEKNDENQYRITNNFNGLIEIENNEIYNKDIKIKSILKYYIVEYPLVTVNLIDDIHMSNKSYEDFNFNPVEFTTINDHTVTFMYYYDDSNNISYIKYGDTLFETRYPLN